MVVSSLSDSMCSFPHNIFYRNVVRIKENQWGKESLVTTNEHTSTNWGKKIRMQSCLIDSQSRMKLDPGTRKPFWTPKTGIVCIVYIILKASAFPLYYHHSSRCEMLTVPDMCIENPTDPWDIMIGTNVTWGGLPLWIKKQILEIMFCWLYITSVLNTTKMPWKFSF